MINLLARLLMSGKRLWWYHTLFPFPDQNLLKLRPSGSYQKLLFICEGVCTVCFISMSPLLRLQKSRMNLRCIVNSRLLQNYRQKQRHVCEKERNLTESCWNLILIAYHWESIVFCPFSCAFFSTQSLWNSLHSTLERAVQYLCLLLI